MLLQYKGLPQAPRPIASYGASTQPTSSSTDGVRAEVTSPQADTEPCLNETLDSAALSSVFFFFFFFSGNLRAVDSCQDGEVDFEEENKRLRSENHKLKEEISGCKGVAANLEVINHELARENTKLRQKHSEFSKRELEKK